VKYFENSKIVDSDSELLKNCPVILYNSFTQCKSRSNFHIYAPAATNSEKESEYRIRRRHTAYAVRLQASFKQGIPRLHQTNQELMTKIQSTEEYPWARLESERP